MTALVVGVAGVSVAQQSRSRDARTRPADYEWVVARTGQWVADYPDLVTEHRLGESVEGRDLSIYRISSSSRDDLPAMYVGAAIHGNEGIHRELVLLVDALLANASRHPVEELLASRVLWVQPLMNPDGVAARTRVNAAGIDLNRNFGYRFGENWGERPPVPGDDRYGGDRAFSEPETRAIRDFLKGQPKLTVYLDLHGSLSCILTPFGAFGRELDPTHGRLFRELCARMPGYDRFPDPRIHQVIGLGSGYSIDWTHGALGIWSLTWEASHGATWKDFEDPRVQGVLYLLREAGELERARPTRRVVERLVDQPLQKLARRAGEASSLGVAHQGDGGTRL